MFTVDVKQQHTNNNCTLPPLPRCPSFRLPSSLSPTPDKKILDWFLCQNSLSCLSLTHPAFLPPLCASTYFLSPHPAPAKSLIWIPCQNSLSCMPLPYATLSLFRLLPHHPTQTFPQKSPGFGFFVKFHLPACFCSHPRPAFYHLPTPH